MKPTLHKRARRLLAGAALLLSFGTAQAAFDAFLKLDGVEGESREAAHAGWIDVSAMRWEIGASAPAGGAQFSELRLLKLVDGASPRLYEACASGKHFARATVNLVRREFRRARFYQIVLEDVLVGSVQASRAADEAGSGTSERLQLAFARMTWTYNEFALDGQPIQEWSAYWDTLANQGGASTTPAMRVSAGPTPAGDAMVLSFPARAGATYRVLAGLEPSGPYAELKRFTVDAPGIAETTVPAGGSRRFYLVDEVP